jgi:hypothetical protein
MGQMVLATLRCGEFFYAPTGQKANSTGQRPVKKSSPITIALKGQKPKGGGKNFDSPTRQNLIST